MAEIAMRPDNTQGKVWWLHRMELGEALGRIDQEADGRCTLTLFGLHWSRLKSFARSFDSPASASQLYFKRR